VILTLSGSMAVQIAQYGFDRFFHDHPPPIEAQVRGVLREAADDGYRAMSNRLIDLDGDGTKSRLILLRKVEEDREPRSADSSDELRIYDVEGSRLKLNFSFRPVDAGLAAVPRGGWPDRPKPYDLQLTDARDLDGNGAVEPILQVIDYPTSGRGDPSQVAPPVRSTRPFMLFWNFGTGDYDVVSLIRAGLGNRAQEVISDTHHKLWSEKASAADAIAIRESQDGPLLAAAVTVREDAEAKVNSPLQIHTYRALKHKYSVGIWHLYPDGLGEFVVKCQAGSEPVHGYTAARAIDDALIRPRMC
jgi:hypothetical protein